MTQDKQPITEDKSKLIEMLNSFPYIKIELKDEIIRILIDGQKALEELPKLREQAYNLLAEKEQTRTDFISYKKLAEITVKQKEEENQKLKDGIKASKDVIDILWKQKQEVMNYAEQLKRTHQPIAESLAKILGIELNYD